MRAALLLLSPYLALSSPYVQLIYGVGVSATGVDKTAYSDTYMSSHFPANHTDANAWCAAANPQDPGYPYSCALNATAILCYSGGDDLDAFPAKWGFNATKTIEIFTPQVTGRWYTDTWSHFVHGFDGISQYTPINSHSGPGFDVYVGCVNGATSSNCNDWSANTTAVAYPLVNNLPAQSNVQFWGGHQSTPACLGMTRFLCICQALLVVTKSPSRSPTRSPTKSPNRKPTRSPSTSPTSAKPSRSPTRSPSRSPSRAPTTSPTSPPTSASPITLRGTTSLYQGGAIGNRAASNALCNPCPYALLSYSGDSALNLPVPQSQSIIGPTGHFIAQNWSALFTLPLHSTLKESGVITTKRWWTGTLSAAPHVYTCNDWTTSLFEANGGRVGRSDHTGPQWVSSGRSRCSVPLPLICVCP